MAKAELEDSAPNRQPFHVRGTYSNLNNNSAVLYSKTKENARRKEKGIFNLI